MDSPLSPPHDILPFDEKLTVVVEATIINLAEKEQSPFQIHCYHQPSVPYCYHPSLICGRDHSPLHEPARAW